MIKIGENIIETFFRRQSIIKRAAIGANIVFGKAFSASETAQPGDFFEFNGLTYGVVEGQNGTLWLDRNLGATKVAESSTDSGAYGDMYQWGRLTDGHEKRNSGTTGILSSTDEPGHGDFILNGSLDTEWDWRWPQNNSLWQGVDGINNPAPPGWRIPTEAEWNAERNSWGSNNASGAFGSPLKLPVAGLRRSNDGVFRHVNSLGYCWSSTMSGVGARRLYFGSSGAGMYSNRRAFGGSVRCIKDY